MMLIRALWCGTEGGDRDDATQHHGAHGALPDDARIRCLPASLNVSGVEAYLQRMKTAGYLRGEDKRIAPTVESLAKAGRLFFADYRVLDGVNFKGGAVLYVPIVLLWLPGREAGKHGSGKPASSGESCPANSPRLMPLAIQLTRREVDQTCHTDRDTCLPGTNAVYTPDGDQNVWQLAKLHALQADGVVHQAVSHLGYTHLATEPFLVAFARRWSPSHHLKVLTDRHTDETLSINELGRRTLVNQKGLLEATTSLSIDVRPSSRA